MNKLRYYLICIGLFSVFSANAQSPGAVIDMQHYGFNIQLNDQSDTIKGKAEITLQYLKDAGSFKVSLVKQKADGKGMLVSSVTENGANLQFQQDNDAVTISAQAKSG